MGLRNTYNIDMRIKLQFQIMERGNTMELKEFLELKDCTLSIDWSGIENDIGFQLHDDLKKLYSRTYTRINITP